ncbi:hypothetical protein ACGE0T_12610 [Parabacteroides sp. APC149_11_2_Y6]
MDYLVKNGIFKVSSYNVLTKNLPDRAGSKKYSCSIVVEFCPNSTIQDRLKQEDRICLVQAVCDEVELQTLKERVINAPVLDRTMNRDNNKTAGFANRLVNGWAIDQQIYDGSGKLCNLDPRYVEQRLAGSPYRDHADFEKKGSLGYVQNYVHGMNGLDSAILSDEPDALYSWGGKIIPIGSQKFEVVAMLDKSDGTKEYIGSLCWGWKIEKGNFNQSGEYEPALSLIEIVVSEKPTSFFIDAAKGWNNMPILNNVDELLCMLPCEDEN